MARVLIIAYGNPMRCDDGLGLRAAEELSRLGMLPDIEITTCYQLAPELAEEVSQASLVVFVDAARSGVPGQIVTACVRPCQQRSVFTHDFSPASILGLAQELYGKCPEAHVVSVCGECFDHGEAISVKVMESLPSLIAVVEKLIARTPP